MKQIYLLLLSLFLLNLNGCTGSKNEDKNQLLTFNLKELPKVSTIKLSELGFDDIEYIPLETNDLSVMSGTNDIFFPIRINSGEKFFLVSRFNTILKFSDDGRFLMKIGKVGRGPNEFMVAHDVEVNEKTNEIYLLARWQKKFFVYSESGELIRKIPFSISPNEFSFFENGILCYDENHMGDIKDSYNLIDSSGSVKKSFVNKYPFKNHDAYGIYHENIFYHFNQHLFKKEVYSDTIFEFENQNFKPHIVIEVGEKLITPSARSEFDGQDLGKNFIIPMKLFEFGDYVYYEFIYRIVIPNDVLIFSFIGSKKTDFQALIEAGKGIINDLDGGMNIVPRTVKDDNTLIALVDVIDLKKRVASQEFQNSNPIYPEKKKELIELANRLKDTDNPVLMLVRLKKK